MISNFRQWVDSHRTISAFICFGLVIVVVAFLVHRFVKSGNVGANEFLALHKVYYYDLNTGKQFVAGEVERTPITAPSDQGEAKSGVRAMVFSCGNCADQGSQFTGYLQRSLTPDERDALNHTSGRPLRRADFMAGMIAVPDGKDLKWVEHDSEAGRAVIDGVNDKCGGKTSAVECNPF